MSGSSALVKVGRALPTAYKHGPATSRPVIVGDEYVGRIVPVREYGRARGWDVYAGAWFEVVPDPDWTPDPGYADYLARNGKAPEDRANMMLGHHRGKPVKYPGILIGTEARLADAIRMALAWEDWPVQCWTYMSGDHFAYPCNSGCATSRYSAVEGLVELFELGNGRRARELRKTGSTSLGRNYGAEYCEVAPCECPECRSGCTVENADDWSCSQCQ